MSNNAIKVENLGKCYQIGELEDYYTLRDSLTNIIKYPFKLISNNGRNKKKSEIEFIWALKDINFEVKQGEIIGIIGRNGAGKSTLLKILSRITTPTEGKVKINGRVGSLLEVGTGFHPELTGRENIFLNGSILGMSKKEIERKFDEIVDFAEVDKFLDTPVKRYSSGMYIRLAFAVAAHMESEILVVDEVLAVGDIAFQKKCLGKMEDVSKDGRTVLFVSHNLHAISNLAPKSIVLENGHIIFNGITSDSIKIYNDHINNYNQIYESIPNKEKPNITKVELLTSEVNNIHHIGEKLEVRFEINCPISIFTAALAFQIVDQHQIPILHFLTLDNEIPMCRKPGIYKIKCIIPKLNLYIGHYRLKVHFASKKNNIKYETIEDICPFEIVYLGQQRDYDWNVNQAKYVEKHQWELI